MRIALDTNCYTDFARGEPAAVAFIHSADQVYVPFIVLGEIAAGFEHGTRRTNNEHALEQFLGRSKVVILYADLETTRIYGSLWNSLRMSGTPIPTNDIWIAALAVQHGLTLYSRDDHFNRLPQVPRV